MMKRKQIYIEKEQDERLSERRPSERFPRRRSSGKQSTATSGRSRRPL